MKRLLCVLMVMVMAVLLVPTIAGADDVKAYINFYVDGKLQWTTEIYESYFNIVGTDPQTQKPIRGVLKTANIVAIKHDPNLVPEGRVFKYWEREDNASTYNEGEIIYKMETPFGSVVSLNLFAVLGKPEAPAEPEPVVVVEEKKPEEPHVHAEAWVEGTPATCTHTGLTDGSKCKWCGEVLLAQEVIPKLDHVYSMWVSNGNGRHYTSCLYCGNKIDAACEKVQLPIKSTSGAAVILCPVCGDCSGATATAVKGLKVGEGAPYRGTLRVWNIDAGDGNKYLAVSFDRFGKIMQPEGEVSVTLPDDLKGTTAGVIGADGNVKTVQESNGTLKLDFTGSKVVVLKGN